MILILSYECIDVLEKILITCYNYLTYIIRVLQNTINSCLITTYQIMAEKLTHALFYDKY